MPISRGARAALLLALGGALPACGDGGGAEPPAPITQNEQQAVAEAAEMLNDRAEDEGSEPADTPTPDSNE